MLERLTSIVLLGIAGIGIAAAADGHNSGSIQGSVADAINAQPLSNVSVTLLPVRRYTPLRPDDVNGSMRAATSDPNGRFEIADISPGEYFLVAKKTGFLDRTFGSRILWKSGMPITIHTGEVVTGVAVNLLRGAVISGAVENEDGEPFANVSVRALQYQYSRYGKRLMTVATTTTNDRGEYRLHGLMPGNYYVACSTGRDRVIKENGVSSVGRYPVTFFPSVTTLESAVPTPVKAGEEAIANLTLTATKAYTLRGKIAGRDPNTNAVLMAVPALSSGEPSATQKIGEEDSRFEIKGVVPGDYSLRAMGISYGATATGKIKVAVDDRDLNDLLITLEYTRPPVSGRVFTGRYRGGDNLKVQLLPGTSDDTEEDDDSTMTSAPKAPRGSPVVDSSGMFSAAELARDARLVFATVIPLSAGFEDSYVASVRRNGEDVTNSGFSPAQRSLLDITYANDGGRLDGSVVTDDGQTIPGATVVVVPDDPRRERRDLYHLLRADQHGDFMIRGLAPGEYKVLAWEGDVEMEAIYDADFMKPFLAMSKTQTVRVNSRGKYDLALNGISDVTDVGAK